jgi:phosphatidylcholine synthase
MTPEATRTVQRLSAWSVHLLTASGAAWAMLALVAIGAGRFKAAVGWMVLAVAVDAIDGPLARLFSVKTALPSVDGALLDNLVDYVNYVIVPAFLLYRAALLPDATALASVCVIVFLSAFQFVHTDAKTDGESFRGFPCYWNVAAFYLLALRPNPWIAQATVVLMCVLLFVPILFVHPTRTRTMRRLTLTLTAAWSVSVLVAVARYPDSPIWLLYGSTLYFVYYIALSLKLTLVDHAPQSRRVADHRDRVQTHRDRGDHRIE